MAINLRTLLQRFLSSFFEVLYTDLAHFYDLVAWLSSMGQWRQWGEVALMDLPPGRILELGHGPAHLMTELAADDTPCVGLDPSPQMGDIAHQRLSRLGVQPNLVRGRAQELPFASQAFHCVISTFPSEYITSEESIRNARRVLRPGGLLIIVGLIEITGKSLPDRFSRWLYNITGQSGKLPDQWLVFLESPGFKAELETIQLPRSRVTKVVARRV